MQKSSHALLWTLALIIVAALAYWLGTSRTVTRVTRTVSDSNNATAVAKPAIPPAISKPAVTVTAKPRVEGDLIYSNPKYGFTFELPARWKDYRVIETRDAQGNTFSFELKKIDGSYGSVFGITAFTRAAWKNMESEPLRPSYLGEKNAYVFGYSFAQDDSHFAGFDEPQEGLIFKGPIFDAQEIIIPSFEIK